ncbi:MAG: efflux RND transporter permease subunit [Bacteroidia bacterium]
MFWNRIATFILKNRPLFVTVILSFTALMGYFATTVELEYSMQKLVPSEDKDFKFYKSFKEKFGDDGNKLVCALETEDLFDSAFYNDFAQTCDNLNKISGVKGIISPSHLFHLYVDTLEYLRMKRLVPKGIISQKDLDSFKSEFANLKFYDGLIYNKKSKVSLVLITLDVGVLNSPERISLIESIRDPLFEFGERHNKEIHLSGLPYIRFQNATYIKREILLFTALAFIVTALLILLLFRNFKTLFVSLLFISIGVVTMLGIQGILGFKLNILSGLLPPLLVVVGVQNTIYIINQYHEQYRRHRNQAKALTRIISHVGVANFLINFTTSVGFGTFYFTHTTILEQFGLVAFITINLIFLINIIGIPILYSFFTPPTIKQTKHLDNRRFSSFLNWVTLLINKRKRRIFYWFSLFAILGLVFMFRLKPLAFMVDDIPKDSKIYTDMKFIQEHFNGALPYEIVVTSYEEGNILNGEMLAKCKKLQKAVSEYSEMSKPMSLVEIISAANQAVHDDDPRYYRIPSNMELGNLALMFPESNSNSTTLINNLVDSTYSQMRISYQMKDVGSERMDEINQEIQEKAKHIFSQDEYDVKITGTSKIFLKGNDYLFDSLLKATFWSLLIISLTMSFLFPSWRMVIIAIIPNFVPLVITAGMMGLLGLSLKPSTILIFSISFGITVDSTIHFISTFRREVLKNMNTVEKALAITIDEVGISMMYSALAVCSGFAIFIFSDFRGTQSLGWLTGLTIFGGLATNLFLLPALIYAFKDFVNAKVELKDSMIEISEEDDVENDRQIKE